MTKRNSNDCSLEELPNFINKPTSIWPINNQNNADINNNNFISNLVKLASARMAYKNHGYLSSALLDGTEIKQVNEVSGQKDQ